MELRSSEQEGNDAYLVNLLVLRDRLVFRAFWEVLLKRDSLKDAIEPLKS